MSTNETIHTSSTGGQKAGNDVRPSLIPGDEFMEVCELYGKGAKKYSDGNWQKGYKWSLSYDALNRHLWEWWSGRETDDGEGGTGLSHLTCVIFHAFALMWFRKHRNEFDDRPSTLAKDRFDPPAVAKWGEGPLWKPELPSAVVFADPVDRSGLSFNAQDAAKAILGTDPVAPWVVTTEQADGTVVTAVISVDVVVDVLTEADREFEWTAVDSGYIYRWNGCSQWEFQKPSRPDLGWLRAALNDGPGGYQGGFKRRIPKI